MKKIVINFSGKAVPCTHSVNISLKKTSLDITLEVSRAVDEVRDVLLDSEKNGVPVTIVLPDHGVTAVAIVQAVRGLIGRTPYVQSPDTEEVDTESIREAFRESLA